MHYYVCGVNGSGKSSVLRAIEEKSGIAYIHGTNTLMEYLEIPGDYDALRAMDQAEVLSKYAETALWITTKYAGKPIALDTHIMNLTNGTMIRRDGPWIANYDALVLITADPMIILERILTDSKDRALFPSDLNSADQLDLLKNYQEKTIELAEELSVKYNLPLVHITNNSTLDEAVKTFITATDAIVRAVQQQSSAQL